MMQLKQFDPGSPLLVLSFFFLLAFFLSCAFPSLKDSYSTIESIDISVDGVQREKTSFTILNKTVGSAAWRWEIIDSDNGKIVETSEEQNPSFSLNLGSYDVRLKADGKNQLIRHFRRCITVLPQTFSEAEADEVIDLSLVEGTNFVKDFGNKKRPGYRIVMKGKFNGRIVFTGLRGTKRHPVHIINNGAVEVNAENDSAPYAWQFSDNNQFILLDGKADSTVQYGFSITGHPKKSGQVLFIAGVFSKGFEICGVKLRGHQGTTHGAAAIQVQTSYTKECNADNWDFEYFRFHHNKIENASSEGMYIGYFTDEERDTGYTPFRMGEVQIYRDTILNSGWDGIQIASADVFEVHDNYVDGASVSGKRSHSSFLSWNSGNKVGWCYRNTFRNSAHGASVIFGESGKEAYIYSNLFIEGKFPDNITSPAFFFSKVNNATQDVALYIFHNTIHTSRISAKVDYKNNKQDATIPVLFAGNAILQNRLNLKKYPEIAMGSNLKDSSSWTIHNVWRMQEDGLQLQWDDGYHPMKSSPLVNVDFNIEKYLKQVKGGFYDHDGYPLKHDSLGYTAGCFSAYQLSRNVKPAESNGIHQDQGGSRASGSADSTEQAK